MKALKTLLKILTGTLLVLVLLTTFVLWQMKLLNKQGIEDALDFIEHNSFAAVWQMISYELGLGEDPANDPSYGRVLVAGRGHAPWVMRTNLDERPRILNFALAPNLWAAYQVESGSLYQVWEGDILFEGTVYDYRHGPQPLSRGAWYVRHPLPASWEIQSGDERFPATVRYGGHFYGPGRATAGFEYLVSAGEFEARLTEIPDVEEVGGERRLLRRISVSSDWDDLLLLQKQGNGEVLELSVGENLIALPLVDPTAIPDPEEQLALEGEGDLEAGKRVIENSDCLGCHNESHQVVGPAFARIAQKFRGNIQAEPLKALTDSVLEGSEGIWGKVPMPGHPGMPREDARRAVLYILSLADLEADQDVPLDASGKPYAATRDYDIGPRLTEVHPAYRLDNVVPEGFEPKVGGLDFRSDGKLLVTSWDRDGAVFLVDPEAPREERVRRVAEGLQEPLGLRVVGDRVFVLQKQEVTELIDTNGDEVFDRYLSFANDWTTTANFHSFAFGLVHRNGYLYGLFSVCILPGGATCPEQQPGQGKVFRVSLADGSLEYFASGFRTPNGIGLGPGGEIFVNDNQGDYLPSSKLLHIQEGKFYGFRAIADEQLRQMPETPPVVWLPQDEIGNSPTEPALLEDGPYAGQMIHGDVYHGGIKRVYMEEVGGALQGAVMRFSGGFQGGVNRIARGPDGALYIGEIGNPPNWGEVGKAWHGLEKMSYLGQPAFEILKVNATAKGFDITLTGPLAADVEPRPADLVVRQWFYYPTEQYGGPKYDHGELKVQSLRLSDDGRTLSAVIPGLKKGYVVYLALDQRLRSREGETLWVNEAWYTLNKIPAAAAQPIKLASDGAVEEDIAGWEPMFDGESFGYWRNYGSTGPVQGWVIEDGTLAMKRDSGFLAEAAKFLFGDGSGDLIYGRKQYRDFELALEWKISENGNSGIFYFVADEEHDFPWQTGLEMQVLHNEGHPDGKIEKHRAGDLYDLVSAEPETVKGPGQWNAVRIKVCDNRVEHWLNGERVVSYTHGDAAWDALVAGSKFSRMPDFGRSDQGYIVLQDHGDPVWYRNLKIREGCH